MPSWTTTRSWTSGETPSNTQFNNYLRDGLDIANRQFTALSIPGSVSSGAKAGKFIAPFPLTIGSIFGTVGTASTSGSLLVNVLRTTASSTSAAASIFSTGVKVTISSGNFASTATSPTVTALSTGDWLTVSVTTQSGSAATADATIVISFTGA